MTFGDPRGLGPQCHAENQVFYGHTRRLQEVEKDGAHITV